MIAFNKRFLFIVKMWAPSVAIVCILIEGLTGLALPSNPSIIIVGSGAAGIAAATKLLKNNFTDITILEAENRIGGRINSVLFGDAYVDLGAEFCHGEKGNIVYSMAKDLNVLEHSNESMRFFFSNGEQLIDKQIEDKILNLSETLNGDNGTVDGCELVKSLGECADHKMHALLASAQNRKEKEILSAAKDWIYNSLCAFGGALDLHDIKATEQYLNCEGDLYMHWNGLGYKTILEILMQKYPNHHQQPLPIDDRILLNKEVTGIFNWHYGNKVTVTTKDGILHHCDHLIFTPSVGVLKAKHDALFKPTLPKKKINSIKNIGFGAIVKIILHFPSRWWKETAMWAPLWTPNDKEQLREKNLEWLTDLEGFAPAENNPNVLIAWFAGKYVPTIESIHEHKVEEGIRYFINKFLAPHYNVTMPARYIRTKWLSNENFRGTYSYESVKGHSQGGKNFQKKLGRPLKNQDGKLTVLFAGEATHPHYYSTVHGAIESGYREADRLIKIYRN